MKTSVAFMMSLLVSVSTAVVFYVAPDCDADVITDVALCQQAAGVIENFEWANAFPSASIFEAGGCFERIPAQGGVWFNPAGWSSVQTEHRICATTTTDPSSLWDFYVAQDCGSDVIKNADTCRLAAQAISGMTYANALASPNSFVSGGCVETAGGAVYFNPAVNSLSTSANVRLCASFLGHSQAAPLTTTSTQSATIDVSTAAPTANPTSAPTSSPTGTPTSAPTSAPTSSPTCTPTSAPTSALPTSSPAIAPISSDALPTTSPTAQPTTHPSAEAVLIVDDSNVESIVSSNSDDDTLLGADVDSTYHISIDHMALVIGIGFLLICITCFSCDRHRRKKMVITAKEDATPEGFETAIDCEIAASAPSLTECTRLEVDFEDMQTPGEIETTCGTCADLGETPGERGTRCDGLYLNSVHSGEPGSRILRKTIEAEFSPAAEPSLPRSSPRESPRVSPLPLCIEKPLDGPESPRVDLPRLRGIRMGEDISISFNKLSTHTLHLKAGESAMTMSSAYESPSAYLSEDETQQSIVANSPSLTADLSPRSFTADGPQGTGAPWLHEAKRNGLTADGPQRTGGSRSPNLIAADVTPPSYSAEGPRHTGAPLTPSFTADFTPSFASEADRMNKRKPQQGRTGWESCKLHSKKRSVAADFHQRVYE